MANSLNKVTLIGFVGKDPEIRVVPSTSKEVASFTVATSDTWKDKATGEFKSKTEWHNIVVWNEHFVGVVKSSVKKGVRVYIEGELTYRQWQDKNTNTARVSTEIVLNAFSGSVIPLERKPSDSFSQENSEDNRGNVQNIESFEDEIPF